MKYYVVFVLVYYNTYMQKWLLFLLIISSATVGWAQRATELLAQAKREADPQTQIKLLTQAVKKSPK